MSYYTLQLNKMETINRNSLLLPHRYHIVGWVLFALSWGALGIGLLLFNVWRAIPQDYSHYLTMIFFSLIYISAFFVGLSREKHEDEFIMYLRKKAIVLSSSTTFLIFIVYNLAIALFPNGRLPMFTYYLFPPLTSIGFAFVLYVSIFKISLFTYWRKSNGN